MSTTTTYSVAGMTCGHCVNAVAEELMTIPGVHEVRIELSPEGASPVHVTSDHELGTELVQAAIDEAGYSLVADVP